MKKLWIALTLLVLLITVLSGCESQLIDNGLFREECEDYLNAMLAKDFDAAHALTPAIDESEHRAYFEQSCQSLTGATSYELTQTGWQITTSNGVTVKTAAYQLVTDNGVTCQIRLRSIEGVDGISNIAFRDSTAFIESVPNLKVYNPAFTVFSLVSAAFCIWMIVDCARRTIPKKVLWILLILVSIGFGCTWGSGTMRLNVTPGLFFSTSSLKAIISDEVIALNVFLPVGALIYFFRRKKWSLKHAPQTSAEPIPIVGYQDPAISSAVEYPVPSKDAEKNATAPQEKRNDSDISPNE
ncbi:MAG: hypothetical protein IJX47_07055 [Clostridia bacterium]|nr:hypothetical protein [Clostridia bacterium]